MMSIVVKDQDGNYYLYAKGSDEVILKLIKEKQSHKIDYWRDRVNEFSS